MVIGWCHCLSGEYNYWGVLTSQEIPHILWKAKVHYRSNKCPPTRSSTYPKIPRPKYRLNIILPSTPGYPKCPLSLRFPHLKPEYTSPLHRKHYMPRPFNSRIYRPSYTGWAVPDHEAPHYVVFSTPVTSTLLYPTTLLSTLHSNTLKMCSSLNVSDQITPLMLMIILKRFKTHMSNFQSSVTTEGRSVSSSCGEGELVTWLLLPSALGCPSE